MHTTETEKERDIDWARSLARSSLVHFLKVCSSQGRVRPKPGSQDSNQASHKKGRDHHLLPSLAPWEKTGSELEELGLELALHRECGHHTFTVHTSESFFYDLSLEKHQDKTEDQQTRSLTCFTLQMPAEALDPSTWAVSYLPDYPPARSWIQKCKWYSNSGIQIWDVGFQGDVLKCVTKHLPWELRYLRSL